MKTISFKSLQAKAVAITNVKEVLIPPNTAASFINDLSSFWSTCGFEKYPFTYANIMEYLNEENLSELEPGLALSRIASHTDDYNDTIANIALAITTGEGDSEDLQSQEMKEESEAFRAKNCEEDFAMFPEEHEGEYY